MRDRVYYSASVPRPGRASPLRYLDSPGYLRPGFVAAHMIHLDEADIELAARRMISVAHCPASNTKAGRPIAKASDMVAAGVRLGLGTDGPLSLSTPILLRRRLKNGLKIPVVIDGRLDGWLIE